MKAPASLETLTSALRCLPGVGPKSAQRIAYYLLQHDRSGAARLAASIDAALTTLRHCLSCNNFSESETCARCASGKRNQTQLCIVETPVDMNMVEQAQAYSGLYYVLMGRLSPLDGIGPRELGLERLLERIESGGIREVILATNYTNEGEATAHYLSERLRSKGISVTRIARGVPVGGELEFIDSGTLAQAIRERRSFDD